MEFTLPIRGFSEGLPANKERPETSGYMNNVRPRDVLENRIRLGQRPGIEKWFATRVTASAYPVIAICSVTVATI